MAVPCALLVIGMLHVSVWLALKACSGGLSAQQGLPVCWVCLLLWRERSLMISLSFPSDAKVVLFNLIARSA